MLNDRFGDPCVAASGRFRVTALAYGKQLRKAAADQFQTLDAIT